LRVSVQAMNVLQRDLPLFKKRQVLDVEEGFLVRELLADRLGCRDLEHYIVSCNGRRLKLDEELHDGDDVMVFPMMAGG
jgi:molybdopterin converting factor small subunit